MARHKDLFDALFRPASVVLVGVSGSAAKTTGRPLQYLAQHGFEGTVYAVNPMRDQVQGTKAYKSLHDLPERPDHAFVLLDAPRAIEAVETCAELAIPVVTVLAGGFAEAGEDGQDRQRHMVAQATARGTRLLGPNSIGLVNMHSGLTLTVNAAYEEEPLPAGRFALLSQSGSMLGGLMSRALRSGVGFSKLVSLGNEADLTVGEIGMLCLDDPETDGFLLFLETIRDADRLATFAREAYERGKPVLAFKLGRSGAGQELAKLHTGALLADDAAVDAFLRAAGIPRLTSLEGLIEAGPLFTGRTAPERTPRIGVVTTTGGGGATLVDRLAVSGLSPAVASEATLAEIAKAGVDAAPGPMVDVTLAGTAPDIMRATLKAVTGAEEFDLVLVAVGSSARFRPELAVQPIIDCEKHGKPVAAFLVPDAPEAARALAAAGIPAFTTAESCADAVSGFAVWQAPRAALDIRPPPDTAAGDRILDEAASLAFLGDRGLPVVPHVLAEIAALADLELPFDFPVVAKACAAGLAHKTEAGGVVTGLESRDALIAAAHRIKATVEAARPDTDVTTILIQPLITSLAEVLVGYRHDPHVGPVITLAPGGTLAELYNDKAVRLAPVDVGAARDMIDEVTGLAPIRGYRNLPEGDLAGLAEAIAALSRLSERGGSAVLEAEINPLLVRGDGVVAVDAVVRLAANPADG